MDLAAVGMANLKIGLPGRRARRQYDPPGPDEASTWESSGLRSFHRARRRSRASWGPPGNAAPGSSLAGRSWAGPTAQRHCGA